ncbi:glutamine synthetase family protein [Burkholderia guangdongensis]|uniref:glutamine synthetase family protein n=1 Tax=Burkholderia guangdongensis TaxID=1792500 RepID=UPI0015CC2160|nr:glutamine synthetase family protein [Burkholderia guangdongensis]
MTDQRGNIPGLVHFVCQDYVGITRGRGMARERLASQLSKGVGWVPANIGLNPFGEITDNPWGPVGDLLLMPDRDAEVFVSGADGTSPLHYFLSDIVTLDGAPWEACPRHYLKQQIAALDRLGLRVVASFEHEFMVTDIENPPPPFSLAAARSEERLCTDIHEALDEAGIEPEMCLAEYAPRQFEVTCRPADALRAADRAVSVREVVREICRRHGRQVSFSPKLANNAGTNGVHIHLSLWSADGQPLTYDSRRPGGLSELASQFTAGIHAHLPALTALTAPGVVSYQRLRPHSWTAAYACVGDRNREASLRIAPINATNGADPARQANIEYRPADALASPYLALGALLAAGIDGLRTRRTLPALVNVEPGTIPEAEYERYGMSVLPGDLAAAMAAFGRDDVLRATLDPRLIGCYERIKESELHAMADKDDQAICRDYARIY